MGADYLYQEKAIEEIKQLSTEAKQYISHHIRNSLCIILLAEEQQDKKKLREAINHICKDLRVIDC